ncbi:MAG: putative Zn-dependent protease [Gammaproteobacteria bacterium]
MVRISRIIRVCLLSVLLLVSRSSFAQISEELQLPELGSTTSGTISLQKEYDLGRAFLKAFRSQVRTISDPLLQDYLEELIYKLASFSTLKDKRLDIVVVDNKTINAFAVPGGVIGIHNGLLLQAGTEAQLSTVLAHELAHLSQRHFARNKEAQKRNTIPNMAGLLAGIIVAATSGGSAGMAALTAVQAATLQSQLRYSRLNEQEADRVGMQTLVRADMDPDAAANMFEKMQQATRYASNRPPEFLLSHPVTESRISDARNRSRKHPKKLYKESLLFHLMQARVALHFSGNSKDTVAQFQAKLNAGRGHSDADQYGLVLALTANGDFEEAQNQLTPLRDASPMEMSYLIAQAELYTASGRNKEAIKLLDKALSINPGNHPLTMTLADALIKSNQAYRAASLLKSHTAKKPNDPSVWYLLAETHGLAGNIVGVHQARAEFFVLNGVLDRAARQLGYALPLVKNNHLSTTKIKERIKQIKQMELAMKEL